ncbi:cytochrome P450 [Salinifilum ghardaiensis]
MDQLPFHRDDDVLEVPERFHELQREAPVARVRTLTGDPAWLVSGYEPLRELYGEQALGRSHPDPDNAPTTSPSSLQGGPKGGFDTQQEEHRRMRRLLTPAFSAKRMEKLRARIGERIEAVLDDMRTPPVDLHAVLSAPLPVMVICELLGAPFSDHDRLRTWSEGMADLTDAAASAAARAEFEAYTAELMEAKRQQPDEDVISDLVHADEGAALPVEEVARLATGLLFAGHETTMTRIDLGTLLLIRNPEQRAKLLADPELLKGTVEEVLRMTVTPGKTGGVARWAAHDITVGDITIRAGEAVLLANGAANRDADVFEDPDTFDITRSPNPHMAFGHGAHFCIGASLARIELQEVFGRLFQRFPTLQLAVPDEELPVNRDKVTGGLAALPVTW